MLSQITLMLPLGPTAICGWNALLERILGVEKETPPSVEPAKRTAEPAMPPEVRLPQTTLILPLGSTAICASPEKLASLERFLGVEKVTPLIERLKKISEFVPVFSQTTLMLPPESAAIREDAENPLLDRFLGTEKLTPPSVERLKKISEFVPLKFPQATLMLPAESTAICEDAEAAAMLERFFGAEKVTPPLLERQKKILKLPGVLSSQTTLMLPLESTAICGNTEEPALLERFLGVEKVTPPSVERLKKISKLPDSSQTTLMLPLGSTAI